MNKRTFLNLISAGIASPIVTPLCAWTGKKVTNWAGNITYNSDDVKEATSVEQVRSLVHGLEKVKVQGSRHCFNTIADSHHTLLSLKPMHGMLSLDKAAQTVTVEAGITYGQLCPLLEQRGFALHNLASLPHISIAGACSTATHGSGESLGNLATAVTALEMVTASGDLVKLSQKSDGKVLQGAVVGLGALGVVTQLTLKVQPTYSMSQYVYQNLPLAQMKDHFDDIQKAGYSVSLFTDWQKQRVNEIWIKARNGSGQPFSGPAEFYGAKLATRDLHPIAELSAENCTKQMGVPGPWYDRLPHFRMGFTPSAGKELQSEYFVPRHNAIDAILAVERLRDQISPHLLISEIRTIAEDDLWMSTCYRQPGVTIHFTWKPDWVAVKRLLPVIEQELSPFKPRPHWGKLFTLAPKELRSRYEKLPDFLDLAKLYDPKQKFRNQFLDTNLFG